MTEISQALSNWDGRNVLVTGHTGFKGAWLSAWLHRLGANVFGYSNGVPTQPSLYDAAGIDGLVVSTLGDVRDLDLLSRTVEQVAPSVVFHLAAQPLVRASFEDPVETFSTNILGTVNLLETVRNSKAAVEAVVVVTTDKCYENQGWDYGYREVDRLGGKDPYSASKAAAELVTGAYRAAFFGHPSETRVATARAGNVIGGGDWATDRLLPDIVRAAGLADPRVVIRHPSAERPWQHVLDCVWGYLLLAERLLSDPDLAGAWNFGPTRQSPASVSEVVALFIDKLGFDIAIDVEPDHSHHEEQLLALDASKANRQLRWMPRLELRDAVALTASWYSSYLQGVDARELTMRQIDWFGSLH